MVDENLPRELAVQLQAAGHLERLLAQLTVYLVDDTLIDAWAYVTAARDQQGRPIATGGAWIAATAWGQGLPLVTHNRRHFAGIMGYGA